MPERPDPSYYDILGIAPGATPKQVKDAYRRAARTAHPDLGGSEELFHSVAVAYETLSDPARREQYDKRGRFGAPPRPDGTGARTFGTAGPAPRGAGPGAASDGVHTRPPIYLPPFSPDQPPVLPLVLAGRQAHGAARQPGLIARLGAEARARWDGEQRTAALVEAAVLEGFPAARLVNGLVFANRARTAAGHAVLAGYRIAVIDSFTATPGNFHWDGRSLRHQGRPVTLRMPATVREVQELFPECNVTGWILVHGARDNPFDPVIDTPPGFDRSTPSLVQVVNAGTAARTLKAFLAAGPQPNTVQLPVLGRLLAAAGS
ncbi:J domain-containing protein [Arthrobacter sp. TMN-37]